MSDNTELPELSDQIEVMGPGQILMAAREAMGLTQQEVAQRLNFKLTLVNDIEKNQFDKKLPVTFTRGYLKNYAKLVEVPVDDVLASYELLGVAEQQGAAMQSFSKSTTKQAEHNRLMWISYLILALLIASTVVWWLQDASHVKAPQHVSQTLGQTINATTKQTPLAAEDAELSSPTAAESTSTTDQALTTDSAVKDDVAPDDPSANQPQQGSTEQTGPSNAVNDSVVIFRFSGDCWVNIFDANGERIAWGIKKSGYVMRIAGQAPFAVTLGKPELVEISFNGDDIDMSQFNVGNIAKFSLPVKS